MSSVTRAASGRTGAASRPQPEARSAINTPSAMSTSKSYDAGRPANEFGVSFRRDRPPGRRHVRAVSLLYVAGGRVRAYRTGRAAGGTRGRHLDAGDARGGATHLG